MSKTSIYFTPGGKSSISSLIKCNRNVTATTTTTATTATPCPRTNNKQVVMTSNNESTGSTILHRQINTIRYANGGRTSFGILGGTRLLTVLGRIEGQGIPGPLRNRF